MPLSSALFRDDVLLQNCLIDDAAHVTPGTVGDHVRKIQTALQLVDGAVIDPGELAAQRYGDTTAAAVLKYKTRKQILQPWQATPDDIVGKRTIAALDADMVAREACAECILDEPSYRAQPSFLSCWAAAATMVACAHDGMDYSIEALLTKADGGGSYYVDTYLRHNVAIPYPELEGFLGKLGMQIGPSATYTPADLCDLLNKHGPLGFVLFAGGAITHVIVVYGVTFAKEQGQCVVFYQDPDPSGGAASMMAFVAFDELYGQAVPAPALATVNLFYY